MFCTPGRTGRVGTESGDQARCMISVVRHPGESLRVVSGLCERDRQCPNTIQGSDTMHPAASSS